MWVELTTLLIPGYNDSAHEIGQMCEWIAKELGTDVPLHFTAFHPDYKMTDHSRHARVQTDRRRGRSPMPPDCCMSIPATCMT